jgi:hypothetical protein
MEGVTGHIKIDENGDAIKPVTILGFKDGVKTLVTVIQPEEKNKTNSQLITIWGNHFCPK